MDDILSVNELKKYFRKKNGGIEKAVDGVSFSIKMKETLVLAGESGSGKTTIARLLLRAIEPDSGNIFFDGNEITNHPDQLRKIRMGCQMVHQDPYSSMNPRMTVLDIVKEPLEIHSIGKKNERDDIVLDALTAVKMDKIRDVLSKYPHTLSGGQKQRVAIARAIVTNPKLIIADEPVSMLDVSVRAGILELMKEIQEKMGISFLYITHDLSTARYVGHNIAIMYRGVIVESGPVNEVLLNPKHPYTQALIDSISDPDPENLTKGKNIRIKESVEKTDYGCRFHPRCIYAIEKCKQEEPKLEKISDKRSVSCFVKLD